MASARYSLVPRRGGGGGVDARGRSPTRGAPGQATRPRTDPLNPTPSMFDLQRLPTELKTVIFDLVMQRVQREAATMIQNAYRKLLEQRESFSRFLEFIYDTSRNVVGPRMHRVTNNGYNLEVDEFRHVNLSRRRKSYAKHKHLTVADFAEFAPLHAGAEIRAAARSSSPNTPRHAHPANSLLE